MPKKYQYYIRYSAYPKLVLDVPLANKMPNHPLWLCANNQTPGQCFEIISNPKGFCWIRSALSGLFLTALPKQTGTYSELKDSKYDMPNVNVVLSELTNDLSQCWYMEYSGQRAKIISAFSEQKLMPFTRVKVGNQSQNLYQALEAAPIGLFEEESFIGQGFWDFEELTLDNQVLIKQEIIEETITEFESTVKRLQPSSYLKKAKEYQSRANCPFRSNEERTELLEIAKELGFTALGSHMGKNQALSYCIELYAEGDSSLKGYLLNFLSRYYCEEIFKILDCIAQIYCNLEMYRQSYNLYNLLFLYFQGQTQQINNVHFENNFSRVCKALASIGFKYSREDRPDYEMIIELAKMAIKYDHLHTFDAQWMISEAYLRLELYYDALDWINQSLKILGRQPHDILEFSKGVQQELLMKKGEILWRCEEFEDYIECHQLLSHLFPKSRNLYESLIQEAKFKLEIKIQKQELKIIPNENKIFSEIGKFQPYRTSLRN